MLGEMLENTNDAYGWIAILLHWAMAVTIFFLFGLGLYMVDLSYYDAWYRDALELHKSIGVTLMLLWSVRVVWKLSQTSPKPLAKESPYRGLEIKLANFVHHLLYFLMFAIMLTGYLISTADGRGISVFGLFELPSMGEFVENQEDLAGEVHFFLAWGLMVVVAMHLLAALKHHFVDKDATLIRMLNVKSHLINQKRGNEK